MKKLVLVMLMAVFCMNVMSDDKSSARAKRLKDLQLIIHCGHMKQFKRQFDLDLDLTDSDENTLIDYASKYRQKDIVQFLSEEQSKRCKSKELDRYTVLLDYLIFNRLDGRLKTKDVYLVNHNGWTLLMQAADIGEPEMVQLLLDEGSPVNATKDDGQTAFALALKSCNLVSCYKLMKAKVKRMVFSVTN